MKNKNNIIRQVYLATLKYEGKIDDRISKIINYKNINFVERNPCGEIQLPPESSAVSSGIEPFFSETFTRTKIRKNYSQSSVIRWSIVDSNRIRMFMFRYYKGNVNWDDLFFGNDNQKA